MKDPPNEIPADSGGWYYEMRMLGFDYRLTDFQCALGFCQLDHLPEWVARRRKIAANYRVAFQELPGIGAQCESDGFESSYHLFVIQVIERKAFYERLRRKDLESKYTIFPSTFSRITGSLSVAAPAIFPC